MSVFNEEDSKTVKIIGLTAAGFGALTVALIIIAMLVT
jgi:hypothetical protein